jgi:hypothetical protein
MKLNHPKFRLSSGLCSVAVGFYHSTTWHHNPEDLNLSLYHFEDLKPCNHPKHHQKKKQNLA